MTNKLTTEQLNKLDEYKDKIEEVQVYTVEVDSFKRFSTIDGETAYKLFEILNDKCFQIDDLGNGYSNPFFRWKRPLNVKLQGEKLSVYKTLEDAQRSFNAFESLKPKEKTEKEPD